MEADPITPQMVQHVISLLSSEFRYVIIDTGSGLDEGTLSVLKLCTDLVLVTSTDVPSVRATRKEVEMLDLLGLKDQQRHFVVNRSDARVGLPVSEVEATVGMNAHVTDPELARRADLGEPGHAGARLRPALERRRGDEPAGAPGSSRPRAWSPGSSGARSPEARRPAREPQ